jgi:hypothetical protein
MHPLQRKAASRGLISHVGAHPGAAGPRPAVADDGEDEILFFASALDTLCPAGAPPSSASRARVQKPPACLYLRTESGDFG